MTRLRRIVLVLTLVLGSLALLAAGGAGARPVVAAEPLVEVVVTLPQPPLAAAILRDRQLAASATTRRRLDLRRPASVSYLRTLATAQRRLQARIRTAIPDAQTRWRYGVVANGMAVVVPRSQLATLRRLQGVTVWPSITYRALLDRTPQLTGATALWGPTLATAGDGVKIGIIDDGFDQTHVFFDPTGYTYPAGYPKGNAAYTTPKVIVARAFPPATPKWRYAATPFDPKNSEHATNVAGIAAGNHDTLASPPDMPRVRVSGIAPRAYLGNYKVLTIPTDSFGLDGNAPEIVAGIEAAVKDGMDVINLSLGEPEIEPSRDIVVQALNRAADAGVVPVVAAGNDGPARGTISSPASAAKAITVAASSEGGSSVPADVIAGFSSTGPTPVSLQMKPDVTAPGTNILSSLPGNQWSAHDWSGTSMAAPHVAGGAALLRQRHPTWTVAQIKSALVSTGSPVKQDGSGGEVAATRAGGGRINLPRADAPLIFTEPTGLSFGMPRPGATVVQELAVADAGGGPAPWTTTVAVQAAPAGATLAVPPTVAPGTTVPVTLAVAASGGEGEASGFVVLTRGADVRRVPFWFRVTVPRLANEQRTVIRRPGLYRGNTSKKGSVVAGYRYPESPVTPGVPLNLSGPEQVFRLTIARPVANFGAVVVSHAPGVRVSPRLVHAGNENRLVGVPGLPQNINPYQNYGHTVPAVGAILPAPGAYDFVFDTPARGKPGAFAFRVWVDDVTPPTVRLLPQRGRRIRFALRDSGSGVDPVSIQVKVDGRDTGAAYDRGIVSVPAGRGRHRVAVTVSDYQETKNMEDVARILPNTRTVTATVRVR